MILYQETSLSAILGNDSLTQEYVLAYKEAMGTEPCITCDATKYADYEKFLVKLAEIMEPLTPAQKMIATRKKNKLEKLEKLEKEEKEEKEGSIPLLREMFVGMQSEFGSSEILTNPLTKEQYKKLCEHPDHKIWFVE